MILFVELVKAVAWPIVVVIVALGFKPNLIATFPALLRRKLAFKVAGFEATIDAAEQLQASAENPATEKLPQRAELDPSPRLAVNLIETRLRSDVEAVDATRKEAILLRALAISRLEGSHEFIYNRIFGSQIAGLKRLNESGHATVDDAREFFRPYAEQFPQVYSNYGFDGWLGFLRSNGLIQQNNNILEINDFGRDFLIYLTERRLSESKPW